MAVADVELTAAGQDQIFELAKGYYVAKALLALWRLGLLERAGSGDGVDVEAVAAEGGFEAWQLEPLLDYLIVRGWLERDDGVYRLTERGRASRPYFGYLSTMIGAYEPVFTRVEDLATGKIDYGRDVVRSHEEMTRGLTALEDRLMGTVTEVVRASGARKVLDLGCGSARMLANICALDDSIEAVGLDVDPDSCAVARETAEREGLDGRLTIVQGDAFDLRRSLPPEVAEGIDAVTVMFLLHEILRQRGREGTVDLLRGIADFIRPDGRLVIVEVSGTKDHVYREKLLFVPEYELLHEYTNQRLAPRPEWEAMVAEAGMEVVEAAPVNMCQSFCLVTKPVAAGGGSPDAV
jgi:SAM-dependent methyltransferase